MFLFRYQNFRHTLPSWDSRKKNLDSTYGQFDMPMLRKSLKDKFTLWGHGTHPIHKLMNVIGYTDKVLGHFVAIEDPKIAVWLKLNYDHITRATHNNGRELTYMDSFKNLDDDEIKEMHERATINRRQQSDLYNESHRIRNLNETILRFNSIDPSNHPHLTQANRSHILAASEALTTSHKCIKASEKRNEEEWNNLRKEALDYLEAHKL